MAWLARIVIALVAAVGGAVTSQFPEFAQQYRQRLGGALDELKVVVADFDADARTSGLERDEAVSAMRESADRLVRDGAASIVAVLGRYAALRRQYAALEDAPPLVRPVHVLRSPDRRVIRGAWQTFEPAVPVTAAGFAWGAVGLGLGLLLALLGRGAGRRMIGANRRGRSGQPEPAPKPEEVPAGED